MTEARQPLGEGLRCALRMGLSETERGGTGQEVLMLASVECRTFKHDSSGYCDTAVEELLRQQRRFSEEVLILASIDPQTFKHDSSGYCDPAVHG